MGYKNEIKQKKPRPKTPILRYIFGLPAMAPNSMPGMHKTPKTTDLSYWPAIGKTLPIYVNNFTNSLLLGRLFAIFYSEIETLKWILLGMYGWLILTLQKSIVYGRTLISPNQMIMANPQPIYYDMSDHAENKISSFKITNNPIGGYLCPSGMDGKN